VSGGAYRTLALAEAEPPALASHICIADTSSACPACGLASAVKDALGRVSIQIDERFCTGGRYGFLWLRRCAETHPHMHQRCMLCGAKWVTAPSTATSYKK